MTILAWGEKCFSCLGKKGVKSNKKIEEKKKGKRILFTEFLAVPVHIL